MKRSVVEKWRLALCTSMARPSTRTTVAINHTARYSAMFSNAGMNR